MEIKTVNLVLYNFTKSLTEKVLFYADVALIQYVNQVPFLIKRYVIDKKRNKNCYMFKLLNPDLYP